MYAWNELIWLIFTVAFCKRCLENACAVVVVIIVFVHSIPIYTFKRKVIFQRWCFFFSAKIWIYLRQYKETIQKPFLFIYLFLFILTWCIVNFFHFNEHHIIDMFVSFCHFCSDMVNSMRHIFVLWFERFVFFCAPTDSMHKYLPQIQLEKWNEASSIESNPKKRMQNEPLFNSIIQSFNKSAGLSFTNFGVFFIIFFALKIQNRFIIWI